MSMRGFQQIAAAAAAAEELDILRTLSDLAPRIRRLPGARNTDTPRHRTRSVCFMMWSDSTPMREVEAAIQKNIRRLSP